MLTLASCGGGGGGGSGVISPSQPSSNLPNITGTVVKGPLHNALVFADYNNDGLLSAGGLVQELQQMVVLFKL